MAVDIKKLFNEELPAAIAKNPERAKEVGRRLTCPDRPALLG